jgi:hypothetical protein
MRHRVTFRPFDAREAERNPDASRDGGATAAYTMPRQRVQALAEDIRAVSAALTSGARPGQKPVLLITQRKSEAFLDSDAARRRH